MRLTSKIALAQLANGLAAGKALVGCQMQRLVEGRKRRLAHEREFYRNLKAYCRANNLAFVCEDDWKTAAYERDDDSRPANHSKGSVP
jgi:hypothetical protein